MKNWTKAILYTSCAFLTLENHLMLSHASAKTTTQATNAANASSTEKHKIAPVDIKDFALKDGQPVWFVENPELEIVTIGLVFEFAGQQSNPENKPGLSHFLTSMLDEGAGPYNSQAFKKKLIEKNVHMSISSNQDNITVVFKTITSNIAEAFKLVKLALTEPIFENDAITRLQQQIGAGLMQSLHQPQVVAKEHLLANIWGEKHPYVNNIEKRLEFIPKITSADLREQLKRTLTQSNLKIAAAGNISESKLKADLEDLIASLPKGEKITKSNCGKLENAGKIIHKTMDVPQTIIYFAHPGIDRKDPDFYAAYLLTQALGGNAFESRLWKEIREKRGLSYSISLGLFNYNLKYGMLGGTSTKTASVDEVIKLIREQWQDIAKNGITQSELDLQKQFVTESYPLNFDETSSIVKVLLSYQSEGLPKTYVSDREELFTKITTDDIKRVAARMLKSEDLTFLVVGKSEDLTFPVVGKKD
ncbi:MAG: pitrilysin family protein [Candidatus Paracaedibacteraceae bacterium]|nr:pitrilysin family protein [Candidatus Paracaedibacteraceae bacterium]